MITVQRASLEDVPDIKQLLSETWIDTYGAFLSQETIQNVTTVWHDPQHLAAQVRHPEIFFGVAKDDENTTLGLVTARQQSDDIIVITRLYVNPQSQRNGIGSKLLAVSANAFPDAKRLRLEVESLNEKGLSFYRKQGFKEISRKEEEVEGEMMRIIEMEKCLD